MLPLGVKVTLIFGRLNKIFDQQCVENLTENIRTEKLVGLLLYTY